MTQPRTVASQDEVRRHNLSRLLRLVHVEGALLRSELTARTGLNRSTVKALTADLVTAGLLRESASAGRGLAGRPSIAVAPESERNYVLALDIGAEHLTAMRVGLGGVVLGRAAVTQPAADYGVQRTVRRLRALALQLLGQAHAGSRCLGIGVGVCGVVSTADGVVRLAPNLGWVDVPLRRLLAEALSTGPTTGLSSGLPIAFGNDGDLGARAEHLRGAGRGLANLVFLSGEVGIGGGIILGGRPMPGAGGYGGEIGHMSTDPRGRWCRCGRRGCWETEIGHAGVLASTGAPEGATLADVLTALAAGEQWPQAGMRRVGRALGTGVVNLVNIFNPELVVFGGTSRLLFQAVEPMVREMLGQALTAAGEQVRLALPELEDDAVALGAAELAFASLVADPLATLHGLESQASA